MISGFGRNGTALLLAATCTSALSADDPPGDTVAFKLQSNIIFAPGSVNGTEGLSFIVDTGASVTVLRPDTAKRLGVAVQPLADSPEIEQGGLLGRLGKMLGKAGTATVGSIGLGRAVVRDLPVVVMAVPQAEIPLRMQGIAYDGILGYNFISRFRATFDYKEKTIRLEPNGYVPEDPLAELRKKIARVHPQPTEHGEPETENRKQETVFIGLWPEEADGGVRVGSVVKDSPADAAGVRAGDLIVEAGGKPSATLDEFLARVEPLKPGDTLKLKIRRQDKTLELAVTVGTK